MIEIKLPCFNIAVHLSLPHSGGFITSNLKKDIIDDEDANDRYIDMVDAIESMILAHACAGIDIESLAYIEGIETAVEACTNKTC